MSVAVGRTRPSGSVTVAGRRPGLAVPPALGVRLRGPAPRRAAAGSRSSTPWSRACSARTSASSSGAGPSTGTPGATSLHAERPRPARAARPIRPASRPAAPWRPRTRSGRGPPRRARPSTSRSARRRCRPCTRRAPPAAGARRPAGDVELGVPGPVAVLDPVAVGVQHLAGAGDQDRAERLVAVLERLAGQLDAAPQVAQVGLRQAHGRNLVRFTNAGLEVAPVRQPPDPGPARPRPRRPAGPLRVRRRGVVPSSTTHTARPVPRGSSTPSAATARSACAGRAPEPARTGPADPMSRVSRR